MMVWLEVAIICLAGEKVNKNLEIFSLVVSNILKQTWSNIMEKSFPNLLSCCGKKKSIPLSYFYAEYKAGVQR